MNLRQGAEHQENPFSKLAGIRIVPHSAGKRLRPKLASRWTETKTLAERGTIYPLHVSDTRTLCSSIRVLEGEIFLVVVDRRPESKTFGAWEAIFFSADTSCTLQFASGLSIGWQVTAPYSYIATGHADAPTKHIRWDDPDLDIPWPEELTGAPLANGEELDWQDCEALAVGQSFEVAEALSVELPSSSPSSITSGKMTVRTPVLNNPRPGKILVLGSSGQLGCDLYKHLRTVGQVIGACRDPSRGGVLPMPIAIDVSRPASIRDTIRRVRPSLIVNASGLTDLAEAEQNPRLAQAINATAPAIIAEEAERIGAPLVHFCTDNVFDGSGERPWRETDPTSPRNQYGLTKLRGTQAVIDSGVKHLIIRTGWLYSSYGNNYIRSLIDLMTYRSTLRIANDHFGSPTSTDWVARLVSDLLSCALSEEDWFAKHGGIYHASSLGYASRLDVADFVLATCRQHALPIVLTKLQGGKASELAAVPCPSNSRLDCTKLATTFQLPLPGWREELSTRIAAVFGASDASLLSIA